jgi:hypothetical protein
MGMQNVEHVDGSTSSMLQIAAGTEAVYAGQARVALPLHIVVVHDFW